MALRKALPRVVLNRRRTNAVRKLLDEWLPPILRESRPFAWAVKRWLGPAARADFKYAAFRMTDQEFVAANAAIAGAYAMRDSDTTPAQMDWILGNLGEPGRKILEIGPGAGAMTTRLRSAGHEVWTLDIYPGSAAKQHLQGTVERIPLPDKSFDVIVLAHVIEHSRSLTRAFLEMERVARERVLMVTPRQRFFRWTFDYHLHFFYSGDHLASHAPSGQTSTGEIDGDICLTWDVSRCGREPLPV